jgi:hypothetical protein
MQLTVNSILKSSKYFYAFKLLINDQYVSVPNEWIINVFCSSSWW